MTLIIVLTSSLRIFSYFGKVASILRMENSETSLTVFTGTSSFFASPPSLELPSSSLTVTSRSTLNHTIEPSARTSTLPSLLNPFASSFNAEAGSSKSSSLWTVQRVCEHANRFPSVETTSRRWPAVLSRHVPMYLGKSDGADAAELPSLMIRPKSDAMIEQMESAPLLSGMFGKESAASTAKRERLFPEVRDPRSGPTSRVKAFAVVFLRIVPNIPAFKTPTPGSRTVAPRAEHFTDDLSSVASRVTELSSPAVMRTPPLESFGDFAAVYFSAVCHALSNSERSSSSFNVRFLLCVYFANMPDNYTHYENLIMS